MIDNLQFTRRGVVIGQTYVISDLHLGYHNTVDSMTPRDEKEDIYKRIDEVLDGQQIEHVILNGDIFHEFGSPGESAIQIYRGLVSRIQQSGRSVTVVEGNHDTDDIPTIGETKTEINISHDSCCYLVTHGHREVIEADEVDCCVLGHIHPVYRIRGIEWPIYLYGENVYNKSTDVLITPCFSKYQDGVLISSNTKLNIEFPYVSDFSKMRPIVYDASTDKVQNLPLIEETDKYY